MKKPNVFLLALLLAAPLAVAQSNPAPPKKFQLHEKRPATTAVVAPQTPQAAPAYEFFTILDGTPKGMYLHHDTEAGTGKPIDVYVFAIELQVMNSDGNLEPEGLIIDNFYTAKAVEPTRALNPHNARDCKIWNQYILNELATRNPADPTWPYVEFTTALGARTVQTNEDGQVWWSDDIECWGSQDRFSPF